MAQKVNILLLDDIDQSEASQTVFFGLDGTAYEIDLNEEHAEQLREALASFIGHARKADSRTGRSKVRSSRQWTASDPSAKVVREWARENGYDVPDRGRVPAEVRDAYSAAN
ncbi:Lsr2 family protein [uncultured Nocardioides sp.]|uniref:histone-like nucleoid-structuring protein Lsr2 n=1 Tax=uncultured Nocardioides sp. TaxID=198441 RepID=UPI0026304207|nr:Lsr2 family protein [uncultured Nocardioides sp.]